MTIRPQEPVVDYLGRDLVAELAPAELPLYPAVSRAFFAAGGKLRRQGDGDDMLGFGAGEAVALLTPVILAAAAKAVSIAAEEFSRTLTKAAAETLVQRLRGLFGQQPAAAAAPDALIGRMRAAAFETARAFDLPEAMATVLADAIAQRVRREAG